MGKAEDASRRDGLAVHFRVRFSPRKRPSMDEIDYLLVAEQHIRAELTEQREFPANGDLLSDERAQFLVRGGGRILWRRGLVRAASPWNNDSDRQESCGTKAFPKLRRLLRREAPARAIGSETKSRQNSVPRLLRAGRCRSEGACAAGGIARR